MKKIAIALALSAIGMSAQAVELYGTVDAALKHTNSNGQRNNAVESGQRSDSFIGIKDSENLGNGLRATVTLESQFAVDTGSTSVGRVFNREASIGLADGVQSLRLGRTQTLSRAAEKEFDAFGGGTFGSARAIMDTKREYSDNSVAYSYARGPLSAAASYAFGETSNGSMASASVGYGAGPLRASFTYEHANAGADMFQERARTETLGASYDFGKIQPSFLAQTSSGGVLKNDYILGMKAPVTERLVALASLGRAKIAGQNVEVASVGGEYGLSKRTRLYMSAGITDAAMNSSQVTLGASHSF